MAAFKIALRHASDPRVVEPLLNALRDSPPQVRKAAAEALGTVRTPRAVQPLIEIVEKMSLPDPRMSATQVEAAKREADVVNAAARWAAQHAHQASGATALIIAEDHLTFLFTERPSSPGAYVELVVRTGPEEWFVYRWASGYRPSAAHLDPPFTLPEVAHEAELWHARERIVAERGRRDQDWLAAEATCCHRRKH